MPFGDSTWIDDVGPRGSTNQTNATKVIKKLPSFLFSSSSHLSLFLPSVKVWRTYLISRSSFLLRCFCWHKHLLFLNVKPQALLCKAAALAQFRKQSFLLVSSRCYLNRLSSHHTLWFAIRLSLILLLCPLLTHFPFPPRISRAFDYRSSYSRTTFCWSSYIKTSRNRRLPWLWSIYSVHIGCICSNCFGKHNSSLGSTYWFHNLQYQFCSTRCASRALYRKSMSDWDG